MESSEQHDHRLDSSAEWPLLAEIPELVLPERLAVLTIGVSASPKTTPSGFREQFSIPRHQPILLRQTSFRDVPPAFAPGDLAGKMAYQKDSSGRMQNTERPSYNLLAIAVPR